MSSTGEFTVKDLNKIDEIPWQKISRDHVVYNYYIPSNPVISDGYSYEIIIDLNSNRYWVKVMGGIAGTENLYGPDIIQ
ncbi:hypothetical protein [Microbulbifer variabilis]|uniref:hypothetical protein n=1 Tax=Microbulbifer variabilis TaxID=266805 RepID=UPI00037F8A65|nr:hypothetical protein [Microbulbifer variabilis]